MSGRTQIQPAIAGPARPQGQAPLNPERPPQILGKYAKLIGKQLKSISITYDADGVNVAVTGMPNTPYADLTEASLADFRRIRERENMPSDAEKLQSFKNKFELRLNREFPAQGPATGSDADLQAFLNGLPFRERQAMLMTQKQFSARYPNGFTQA